MQGVGGGDEGVGRDDHFAFQPERADSDLQRHGAVAHRHAMFHAVKFGNPLLELLNHRSVVAQPATFKNIVHIFHEYFATADIGTANVELLFKGRWSAVDGEILQFKDRFHVRRENQSLVNFRFPCLWSTRAAPFHL